MNEHMTTQIENQAPVPTKTGGARFLDELLWLAMGFVLPAGSFTFYKKAAKRSAGWAILFFFLFTTCLAVISSLAFNRQVDTVVIQSALGRILFLSFNKRLVKRVVISLFSHGKRPILLAIYSVPAYCSMISLWSATSGSLNSLATL